MKNRRKESAVNALSRITPEEIGVPQAVYAEALRFLFDRPVAKNWTQDAWYWDDIPDSFKTSALQWTHLQTLIFARCGTDLAEYTNDQIGLGLNYLMSNSISDGPFYAVNSSVPIDDALRMVSAMRYLWSDCFGPRLGSSERLPIGGGEGPLGYVCYMWFDVWSTFYVARDVPQWQDAMWELLEAILSNPHRVVQISALHGIGHNIEYLKSKRATIQTTLDKFIWRIGSIDPELREYAECTRDGMVQ